MPEYTRRVFCKKCNKPLFYPDHLKGRIVKCPSCGSRLRLPEPLAQQNGAHSFVKKDRNSQAEFSIDEIRKRFVDFKHCPELAPILEADVLLEKSLSDQALSLRQVELEKLTNQENEQLFSQNSFFKIQLRLQNCDNKQRSLVVNADNTARYLKELEYIKLSAAARDGALDEIFKIYQDTVKKILDQ